MVEVLKMCGEQMSGGLKGGKFLSLYFYEGILTGMIHLQLQLTIYLDIILMDISINLFFQQDGAPAHNKILLRQYLTQTFDHR